MGPPDDLRFPPSGSILGRLNRVFDKKLDPNWFKTGASSHGDDVPLQVR